VVAAAEPALLLLSGSALLLTVGPAFCQQVLWGQAVQEMSLAGLVWQVPAYQGGPVLRPVGCLVAALAGAGEQPAAAAVSAWPGPGQRVLLLVPPSLLLCLLGLLPVVFLPAVFLAPLSGPGEFPQLVFRLRLVSGRR